MILSFVETTDFTESVAEYFVSDDAYAAFQWALIDNPIRGDVMPGCGGLRKVRWPDLRRGKGKRGGLRIIYLHVPEVQQVLLLDVYDKDQASDVTTEQRKALAGLAKTFRQELIGRRTIKKRGMQ